MAKFTGRNVSVGFGKETTRGTAVAPSIWFPKTDFSFDEKTETLIDDSSVGSIVDSKGYDVIKRFSEGEITGRLAINSIALPLFAMLGNVTNAVDTGTAYKHTYTLSETNQSPSLTIAMDDPVQDYRFPLAIISKMTIKVEPQKPVEVSMTFSGRKGQTSTETVAFVDDYGLVANMTRLYFASGVAGLDAAEATACVKSFSLTLERSLTEDLCISTLDPMDYLTTVFAISGTLEATYQNETDYKTVALNGETKAMRISIIDESKLIGGGSSNPSLEIDLNKVGFTEWSRTVSTNEIVTQSVGFKGFYSITDASAIVIRLINLLTSI